MYLSLQHQKISKNYLTNQNKVLRFVKQLTRVLTTKVL